VILSAKRHDKKRQPEAANVCHLKIPPLRTDRPSGSQHRLVGLAVVVSEERVSQYKEDRDWYAFRRQKEVDKEDIHDDRRNQNRG
jgi:hypothetical protein